MSTVTSTSAHASATGACSNLYDTPVDDAVCAMPNSGNYTALMFSCCKEADVVSYYDGCGLYCLASGQDVQSLSDCLYDEGAAWEDVFCRGNETATATGAATAGVLPASASASILSSGQATSTATPEDGTSTNGTDSKKSAAAVVQPRGRSSATALVASLLMSTVFASMLY
ncbi:hypothetical protein PFICI_01117 [Pestalotiopsis fici W106-1]|uniref:Uncharacterized protein n=1 Tax=Pestalotiopsis fici (strain W106-1 / CGMCC3.15140) TaxID=1229662 RepID=W3XMT0_PESFW|nr:uncharacterized protein PFICI_01117 [Pestalotiopsis fici W106-1]ETS87289.1 hypothetical protein PFICI_01117 [Pestalotiopsis fici W106-1]